MSDRPDRTGMRPSIRLELPVPVSVVGGLPFAATGVAPWIVNLMPPTEFAVCDPVYGVPDWTEVPDLQVHGRESRPM